MGLLGSIGRGVTDVGEGHDMAITSTGGLQTWQEGIAEVVVGSDEQDIALNAGGAVGKGSPLETQAAKVSLP